MDKVTRLAIIGSRDFNDYELLKSEADNLVEYYKITTIVSGGAKGADTLAEKYADEHNLKKQIYYPEWGVHGKKAGFIRNKVIWDNCDIILAFWDGKSPGTKHSIEQIMKKDKIPFMLINYTKK